MLIERIIYMSKSKQWKESERKMAKELGGERVPVSGRQRGYAPDISHDRFSIEHKYGKRILSSRIKEALDQANASVVRDQVPIVTFDEATQAGYPNIKGVFMTLDTFKKITNLRGKRILPPS